MKASWWVRKRCMAICLIGALLVTAGAQADVVRDAISTAADRLVDEQSTHGPAAGSWRNETAYTGSIAAGLVSAYVVTGNEAYRTAAELAGSYITATSDNYYGDGAYALTRLSAISVDPDDNPWRTAAADFYELIRNDAAGGGTAGYIAWYASTNPSTAVFYLAHHLAAARYVNAVDLAIWREGLIDYLSKVADSTADYPVLSLGIATWALAVSGPLDNTLVRDGPAGEAYWNNVTLADLPGLLASHQVPEPESYAGSFYWRFDHDDGDPQNQYATCGYTEDTSFSVLGLVGAAQAGASPDGGAAVQAARQILPAGVTGDGRVYEHIWLGGYQHNFYAGELLQALGAVSPDGDSDDNGCVGYLELVTLVEHWLDYNCAYPQWCDGADSDHDTAVDLFEFNILATNWGKCVGE